MKFPRPKSSALFEYVPVEEEQCGGAAADFTLKPGMTIQGVGRCCKNCRLINGTTPHADGEAYTSFGGFTAEELKPLNDEGREMLALVEERLTISDIHGRESEEITSQLLLNHIDAINSIKHVTACPEDVNPIEHCKTIVRERDEALATIVDFHKTRIRKQTEREAAMERRIVELEAALRKSTIRIGILVGRMRGCEDQKGQSHELSIAEGESWIEEERAALSAAPAQPMSKSMAKRIAIQREGEPAHPATVTAFGVPDGTEQGTIICPTCADGYEATNRHEFQAPVGTRCGQCTKLIVSAQPATATKPQSEAGEEWVDDEPPYCMACEFAYGHAGPCPRRTARPSPAARECHGCGKKDGDGRPYCPRCYESLERPIDRDNSSTRSEAVPNPLRLALAVALDRINEAQATADPDTMIDICLDEAESALNRLYRAVAALTPAATTEEPK